MSEATTGKFGVLATLLAANLDDIPDLPVYKAPPPGIYLIVIKSVAEKLINEKTAMEIQYTVADIVELTEPNTPEEEKVLPGGEFSEAFWFNKPESVEKTLSVLKAKFGGLAEILGTTNLLEILEKMEGMQVKCVITNRADKNDKTKIYAAVRDVVPAG